jgi:hypothetical protein
MLWRNFGYYEIIFVLNTLEFPVIINGQYTSIYLQNWIHFYFVMYRVDHLLFVQQTEASGQRRTACRDNARAAVDDGGLGWSKSLR